MGMVSKEQALKAQSTLRSYCGQNTGCIFKGSILEPCVISSGKDPEEWLDIKDRK